LKATLSLLLLLLLLLLLSLVAHHHPPICHAYEALCARTHARLPAVPLHSVQDGMMPQNLVITSVHDFDDVPEELSGLTVQSSLPVMQRAAAAFRALPLRRTLTGPQQNGAASTPSPLFTAASDNSAPPQSSGQHGSLGASLAPPPGTAQASRNKPSVADVSLANPISVLLASHTHGGCEDDPVAMRRQLVLMKLTSGASNFNSAALALDEDSWGLGRGGAAGSSTVFADDGHDVGRRSRSATTLYYQQQQQQQLALATRLSAQAADSNAAGSSSGAVLGRTRGSIALYNPPIDVDAAARAVLARQPSLLQVLSAASQSSLRARRSTTQDAAVLASLTTHAVQHSELQQQMRSSNCAADSNGDQAIHGDLPIIQAPLSANVAAVWAGAAGAKGSSAPVTSTTCASAASSLLAVGSGRGSRSDTSAPLTAAAAAAAVSTTAAAAADDDKDDEEELCEICYDAAPAVMLRDCGHMLCVGCAGALCRLHHFRPGLCPFCRSVISGIGSIACQSTAVWWVIDAASCDDDGA
jgi:Zinc finger, C3HC4 type (RING finger)